MSIKKLEVYGFNENEIEKSAEQAAEKIQPIVRALASESEEIQSFCLFFAGLSQKRIYSLD